ncbi:hypothetical protein DL766_000129 [Monosporascus sp. MC13-8B]|uniref:Isotrichodermin C-15 hydroxylase n=1 Tax=Monosporascus cannonballus TaxID=155416 RepID=A0ABY0HDR7_9PEZI|nr:hypothetical protein DL762_002330 [Monosporascus cannonballus]RYP40105.1 hypothetical protein DL766_000129 [Monosporascus sp. MC13-8B]
MAFGESFNCIENGYVFAISVMGNLNRYPLLMAAIRSLPKKWTTSKLSQQQSDFSREKVKRYAMATTKLQKARLTRISRLEKRSEQRDSLSNVSKKVLSGEVSQEEMAAHSSTFVIAGGETTATSMTAITYYLLKSSSSHEKLKREIRSRFNSVEEIDITKSGQMPFLQAVIKEGMRILPANSQGLPRRSPGIEVDGHFVPEGTEFHVSPRAMTHDTRYCHEPYVFKPEPWIDPDCKDVKAASQPFSMGPRACIGKNFAYAQMSLELAKLIYAYDMELVDDGLDYEADCRMHFMWWKPEMKLWRFYHSHSGHFHRTIEKQHQKYGSVFRVSPNELSFASVQFWKEIYGHATGADRQTLVKSKFYELGLNITKWFEMVSFDVLGEMAFGESFGSIESGHTHFWSDLVVEHLYFITLADNLHRLPILPTLARILFLKLLVVRNKNSQYARAQVAKRLERKSPRKDFLMALINELNQGKIDLEELTAHSSTLVIAGGETTATTLAATTFYLLQNRHCYEKLQRETRSRFGSYDDIDSTAAQQLPYLQAVISEGLRMYAPGSQGFPRLSPGAFVDGHYIPKGTELYTSAWTVTHDPKNFHEPMAFAYMQINLVLSKMLWKYDLELCEPEMDWEARSRMHLMWWKPSAFSSTSPASYLLLVSKREGGLVTDYTEPQNLFALAVNSPPSAALGGRCAGSVSSAAPIAPFRVGYAEGANHYFFEEAGPGAGGRDDNLHAGAGRADGRDSAASDAELFGNRCRGGRYGDSYKRLSLRRLAVWL